MGVYVGVDFHARTQTVCWCDTADGEMRQHTLDPQGDDVASFYAALPAPAIIGLEASGYSSWFHRLIEQTGHQLLVGDAHAIRQFARRR
jgi:transposase